jgi:nucleoside-diphosphate-sugar epimerase
MRVLVAGGSAFLGQHVVEALARDPHVSIVVMDLRAYDGPQADRVEFVQGDVTECADCERALTGGPFDAVICMVAPDLMRASAETIERVHVGGTATLLEASKAAGVRAFVHVSSIAVMNHFVDHVDVDESFPLPDPSTYCSPYDRAKRKAEDAVLAADTPGGTRTCALRMGGILSDLRDVCLQFALKPTVVLLGRGRPIDMIYGGDAARAVVLAIRGLLERPEDVGAEAFFITKGKAATNDEYFGYAAELLGRRMFVMPAVARVLLLACLWLAHHVRRLLGRPVPGIPLHQFACIQNYQQTFSNAKARRRLGFSPGYDLRQGLERIVAAHHRRCSVGTAAVIEPSSAARHRPGDHVGRNSNELPVPAVPRAVVGDRRRVGLLAGL